MAIRNRNDIEPYFHAASKRDMTPWFTRFRREMNRALRHQEQEMFDHPVAIVIVVSSANVNPVECFRDLSNPHHLPEGFHKVLMFLNFILWSRVFTYFDLQEQYDRNIPKFYVLLHDNWSSQNVLF